MRLDPSMLVVFVVFWATFFVLRSFLFKPVYALLQERQADVDTAHELYQKALAESEAELEEQRSQLAEASSRARAERDEMRREARQQRQDLLAAAKASAEEKLVGARTALDEQVAAERVQLENQSRDLARLMTQRLLGGAS